MPPDNRIISWDMHTDNIKPTPHVQGIMYSIYKHRHSNGGEILCTTYKGFGGTQFCYTVSPLDLLPSQTSDFIYQHPDFKLIQ